MRTREKRAAACVAVATAMLFAGTGAYAQESANDDLNSCVKKEQVVTTAKGAGLGALAGLGAMLVSHKNEDAGKAALIGAVVGGVAGFATAYYTAIDTCYKKNPSWIPESKLQRTKDYGKVKKEIHYSPKQGFVTKVRSIDVPTAITAGSLAEVTSNFIVMTPQGDDAPVTIERKLFVVDGDKQTEVPFQPQGSPQQLTLEPGEQQDMVHIPIPPDAKPNSKFIYQVSVASNGGKPDVQQKELTVSQ